MMGEDWADVDRLKRRHASALEKSVKQVTAANEEFNLLYVGFTRAMVRLKGHHRILFPDPDPMSLGREEEREARPA